MIGTILLVILVMGYFFIINSKVEEQLAGIGYNSFGGLFNIYVFVSLPVYLICGSIYSFLVEAYFEQIQIRNLFLKYMIGFIVYVAGGLLIMGVFLAIMLIIDGRVYELFGLFFLGGLAALLFYHISLLLKFSKKILKSIKRLKTE